MACWKDVASVFEERVILSVPRFLSQPPARPSKSPTRFETRASLYIHIYITLCIYTEMGTPHSAIYVDLRRYYYAWRKMFQMKSNGFERGTL